MINDSRMMNEMMTNTITNKTMNTLLEIAHVMALSDGSISKEEESLIRDLPDHIAYEASENDHIQRLESSARSLKELVALLTSNQDRCLAARVAYLVAAVSRQSRDRQKINADERRVYQELIQELNLSKEDLGRIEASAMQELNQNRSLLRLLLDLIFGDEKVPELLIEKLYYAEG
jgi:tellurite resistance protein